MATAVIVVFRYAPEADMRAIAEKRDGQRTDPSKPRLTILRPVSTALKAGAGLPSLLSQ